MTTYQKRKEVARDIAIAWQYEFAARSTSYEELAKAQGKLKTLAKRYGLTREFRENGLI